MKNFKKKILSIMCVVLCSGFFVQTSAECISLRMLDGCVSAGCGAALAWAGLGTILLPGCLCHASAEKTGSILLGLCACASYLSGVVMTVVGIRILYSGMKKLFGFNNTTKNDELFHNHYQIKRILTQGEPSWPH